MRKESVREDHVMTTVEEIQKLKGSNEAPRKDNRILWRFFYGGECEDPESGENGSGAGYDSRLSDGTYGRCGDDPEDAERV